MFVNSVLEAGFLIVFAFWPLSVAVLEEYWPCCVVVMALRFCTLMVVLINLLEVGLQGQDVLSLNACVHISS